MRKSISPFLVIACLLVGCEKKIDPDLHDGAGKYVIEGIITNTGRCRVLLSFTGNVDNPTVFDGVSGAEVQISDNELPYVTLTEKSAGVYEYSAMTGTSGHTYRLRVAIKDQVFIASCTLPKAVPLDTVYCSLQTIAGRSQYIAGARYTDPRETGNYYNFVQYINQVQNPAIFVNNDKLSNGVLTSFPLISPFTLQSQSSYDIKKGDSVYIEMQCIDAEVYKYWYSMNVGASGSDILATPANPVSNISGGALGYFSAHTTQLKKTIVK